MAGTESKRIGLDAKGRDGRDKISDAVAVLRADAGFGDRHRATIRVLPMRLPSAEVVGAVDVLFEAPWVPGVYIVGLRYAPGFRGRRLRSGFEEYPIFELNRATVDAVGTVTLADGTVLEDVEMLTAPMLAEPTDLDSKILAAALKVIEGGEACFRTLQEDVPAAHRAFVPDIRPLDWGRLRNLKTPPLKQLVAAIKVVDPELADKSSQKIADTLRKFGIRVPIPRPRISRSRQRAKA
jgi:hypothetical protein